MLPSHKDLCRHFIPLLLAMGAPAASAEVALRGPEAIVALLRPYVPAEATPTRRLHAMLAEILATEGYFSATFEPFFQGGEQGLRVEPGPRTTVAGVDLAIAGPVAQETVTALTAEWRLPAGNPCRQRDWSDAKQHVLSTVLANEHAAARLVDSTAEIDTETHQARLHARVDAGPPFRFGALRIAGLERYPGALIDRYNRHIKAGASYHEEHLAALQGVLQATPYFSSVRVAIDQENAEAAADGSRIAPVQIDVRERPAHRLGAGAGISSNTGARIELSYHTPDLFRQAWVLDAGLRIEQKKQTAYADIFLPPDEKNRRHGIGLAVDSTDIEGLRTRREAFGVQTIQQRGSVEQRLSLHWEQERRKPGNAPETRNQALVPNAMWTWRNVDDPLDPRQSTVLQMQVGGGAKALLSDQNFLRLHGRWQQYFPLGRLDTLALRAELGATLADSRQGIPQDYLFRAGGTGSVRGYSYQSLGAAEGSATVGGRYLGVFSMEATHWLNADWGIAAFVDAGDAADRASDLKLAVGYGLGVRWRSPAGPIGLDLAQGQRTGRLHLHFALAIPF